MLPNPIQNANVVSEEDSKPRVSINCWYCIRLLSDLSLENTYALLPIPKVFRLSPLNEMDK